MTLLPRITTSPIVSPSAGTSCIAVSTTRSSHAPRVATPGRAEPPHERRIDPAQQHVAAAGTRERPWEAPAVAVEERQRPEEDRRRVEPLDDDLRERVQV